MDYSQINPHLRRELIDELRARSDNLLQGMRTGDFESVLKSRGGILELERLITDLDLEALARRMDPLDDETSPADY
jgi:hypothetical protein